MTSVEHFIAGQFRAWSTKEEHHRGAAPLPVITISREYGGLGANLAHVLGKRLGFTVWDQELLAAIAEKTGADERFLASLDERSRSALVDIIDGAILGNAYMKSEYLQALMSVVHTIARHGSAIVVGRGCNFILAPEDCLRVRVVRRLELRVADIAARKALSERDARAQVQKLDKERLEFLRQHFKRDGAHPAFYDVVLNSGVYGGDQLAELVVAAYRLKFERDPHTQPHASGA
jgi:hypothetical protein